ncbi:flagellar basal body L-ring protein FlgH [Pyrinomonas methylaliphatogenes]|jgi:flagellar L-ring protein precursor FlgH|uniref:Flagellar L-ring protein n=1 Tax=Pyrinomonas methylaliphatogenes TaxID=454194 RepID=A0A0B6WX92_9BACT|nr:flagellar basal body L-ring protein FlgH [Pyrinomonas methylaliphatogenes]MBX5477589.1 flagellar basal body L-ring protein FlgH [Pyrinomonas methylaliphatogenes]CDM64909.1 flagellar basal body L-ring protein [Pyrinomonas methylaliphatogenes]
MRRRNLWALIVIGALICAGRAQEKGTAKRGESNGRAETMIESQTSVANGSLFVQTSPITDLYSDFKPRRVGDLVFVDVVEDVSASVTSGAKRSRDSGTLGGLVTAAGALPIPGAGIAAGVLGALGSRKYEGSGSTERQSNVRARIVARVVEVLPNGDLRIEARKLVRVNKETETLLLAGIVRQRDVAADNTVPTTAIGDLRVELNGKGVASADNAPGWLFRLFEKIAPF